MLIASMAFLTKKIFDHILNDRDPRSYQSIKDIDYNYSILNPTLSPKSRFDNVMQTMEFEYDWTYFIYHRMNRIARWCYVDDLVDADVITVNLEESWQRDLVSIAMIERL